MILAHQLFVLRDPTETALVVRLFQYLELPTKEKLHFHNTIHATEAIESESHDEALVLNWLSLKVLTMEMSPANMMTYRYAMRIQEKMSGIENLSKMK